MSTTKKFLPWDDPECEIYENLAWDLPGFRAVKRTGNKPPEAKRAAKK